MLVPSSRARCAAAAPLFAATSPVVTESWIGEAAKVEVLTAMALVVDTTAVVVAAAVVVVGIGGHSRHHIRSNVQRLASVVGCQLAPDRANCRCSHRIVCATAGGALVDASCVLGDVRQRVRPLQD